jgi:hypothetical protein
VLLSFIGLIKICGLLAMQTKAQIEKYMSEARISWGEFILFAVSSESAANFYSALIFWFFFIKEKERQIRIKERSCNSIE